MKAAKSLKNLWSFLPAGVLAGVVIFPLLSAAADTSKVKEKASETTEAVGELAKETRDDFKKSVESDLAKLKTEIDILKNKASKASGAAQDSLDRQIADLDVKREKLKKRLNETSKATGAAWTEMKTGISKALDELKVGFGKAKATASGESTN